MDEKKPELTLREVYEQEFLRPLSEQIGITKLDPTSPEYAKWASDFERAAEEYAALLGVKDEP